MEVYTEEAWRPSLHIIALTDGSVAYSSYHSSSLFIPFQFSYVNLILSIKMLQ